MHRFYVVNLDLSDPQPLTGRYAHLYIGFLKPQRWKTLLCPLFQAVQLVQAHLCVLPLALFVFWPDNHAA
jgi:hypothetical protein